MARARYQVLVIPYCTEDSSVQFCLFQRSDMGIWQFIAGGGEEEDISIAETIWGKECFVIPEYAFAVRVADTFLQLSHEHTEYKWLTYSEAQTVLRYDSNKTALWELNRRIALGMLK